MRVVLLVLAGWCVLSLLITVIYAFGARTGYRRGYEDGYHEAATANTVQERHRKSS